MSNSHAARRPPVWHAWDESRAHWWWRLGPALRGLLLKLLHPPLHQGSSRGLYPVLPQREGRGFSQGLILLFKWLYSHQWREVDIYMTWSYALEVQYSSPYSCSESPQHQTFLHEILRQYIIGGPRWRRAGRELGWAAEHIGVSAYLCVHEPARWITHLLRKKFTYLFNKHLLSAYCVLLSTYARLSVRSCEQQRHSPSPSRDKHLNSTQMKQTRHFPLCHQSQRHRF